MALNNFDSRVFILILKSWQLLTHFYVNLFKEIFEKRILFQTCTLQLSS